MSIFNPTVFADEITVIYSDGVLTSSQANSSFQPLIPIPSNNGDAWGFVEVAKFIFSESLTINAQASWKFPSPYGSIIDTFIGTPSVALFSTTVRHRRAPASSSGMLRPSGKSRSIR